jgi:hypothetical protein
MAATATIRDFVVSEDVVEHVKARIKHHLRHRQKRGVPKTSQTLVDRVMAKYDAAFPDKFWHRVGLWYTKIMERTLPKMRGFAATDFFEIVAAHLRNNEDYDGFQDPPDDIEQRVQRDAYVACTAGIRDYTYDDDIDTFDDDGPSHDSW